MWARTWVCVCECVLMNVCILILSANQLLSRGADSCRHRRLLFHHHPSSLLRTSPRLAGRWGGVRGESQPWVLLPRGVITPLWDSQPHTHTHTCTEQHTTCLLCLFLSITTPLHPSIKPVAVALGIWCTHTHTLTHQILMFPPCLSLPSPQMGLGPLGIFFLI